jgi:hypothetical protein
MKISGELFSYILSKYKDIKKKRRRGKMIVHPNSQVKGPELDSTLERLIYHRRGNFLIQRNLPKSLQYDNYIESQRKNLSGLKTESYIKYRTLSFFIILFRYNFNIVYC